MTKKRALISVFDKTNIVDFARKLVDNHNYEIISTGGTYELLKENEVPVMELSEITGFVKLLDGKVKSLHPEIHAAILASRSHKDEMDELKEKNITPIDMVVVNLYPFEEASKDFNIEMSSLIKFIDIGGVTLLRGAAKNYFYVLPVFSPDLYQNVLDELDKNVDEVSYGFRKDLAIKTFQYVSSYDSLIAAQFYLRTKDIELDAMPDLFNITLEKVQDMRYGENPQQKAALYKSNINIDFELLNGKELSFNNLVDLTAAYNIVSEFIDIPAAVIIKHNNPCGVALGTNINDAYLKAFDCDPISAFGGVIGLNEPVTVDIARHIKDFFVEVIVAPDFTEEALEILSSKKNLRLVKVPAKLLEYRYTKKFDFKELPFGTLIQTSDQAELSPETFKVVTQVKPTAEQVEDMVFAWKVCKHVSSNAIVIAKNKKAIGIGVGQTSRIASMDLAIGDSCDGTKGAVIASDGFFPAVDNIQAAAAGKIAAIIQPGGSIKDKDIIAEADQYGISMIFTSQRHFRH